MVESAASTRHISMKGGGYYSKATIGAKDVIDGGTPMIMEALSTMDIPDIATTFTMADSGCADGGTSVTMVGTVLKEVRRRAPNRPIQMVYSHPSFRFLYTMTLIAKLFEQWLGIFTKLLLYAFGVLGKWR